MENQIALRNPITSLSLLDYIDINTVASTMGKIRLMQKAIQSAMIQNYDFGIIPGTDKPTLLKPGAEKVITLFGLTSRYEIMEQIEDYDKGFFAFSIRCILSKNSQDITEGVGHANTKESRYASRWVTENKIPGGVDKRTLKTREAEGKYGSYTQYLMENTDTYTLVNTVLKMAKKRAVVDAALMVGCLSDVFTQDIEDMDLAGNSASQGRQNKEKAAAGTNGDSKPSDSQLKYYHTLCKNLDFSSEKALDFTSKIIEHKITSSKDLTKKEIDKVIKALKKAEEEQNTEEIADDLAEAFTEAMARDELAA